jgi:hypothetical protein
MTTICLLALLVAYTLGIVLTAFAIRAALKWFGMWA